ncbi:MAG: GIY-YIG nuclease family protein [Patescibacteria group bacterium]|nr:GIY-YIG nuclease family protein [Patescibacteria group bacterium]
MWYVYIVKCKDKTLYTGVTTDLKRRIKEHNDSVLGAKYTKGRRPVKLIYSVRKKNKSLAQKEECRIKKLSRAKKFKIINNF